MARHAIVVGDSIIPLVGQTYTDKVTVRAVQQALKDKGTDPGPIDGIYGPKTAAALKSSGASAAGVIDYGALAALGVSAPSAAAAGRAMSDVAAVADATLKMHAGEGNADTSDAAKVQAQASLDNAKKQAAVAVTPAQKAVAQQKIDQASTQLVAATGVWNTNVPGVNRPAWQVGLFAIGGLAVTIGIVSLVGRRK